jgi:NADH-quinone oxidoreductase subunit J
MTHLVPVLAATTVDTVTFVIAASVIVVGAIGVVMSRNPVHSALMLVMTLFGVAVLFVEEDAGFLAAVQVIVYAGAIVVLFLFVIMFLGVDRDENIEEEPLRLQRPIAVVLLVLTVIGLILVGVNAKWAVGPHSVAGPVTGQPGGDVAVLGRSVFTTYLFPFEATAALLVIAVVGAVVLARRPRLDERAGGDASTDEPGPTDEPGDAEEVAR